MNYPVINRGKFLVAAAIVVACMTVGVVLAKSSKRVTPGKWGGKHVNLTVTPTGFDFEFDCAAGSAKGEPTLNRNGKFKLVGDYFLLSGSPSVPRDSRPAEYSGSIKGSSMVLLVTLTDTNQLVGTYQLDFGSHQRLNKCPKSRT